MRASPALTSFNSGELSPLLDGRIDFAKYPNGAKLIENYVLTVQGPAKQRAGTRFVAETKVMGERGWLARFEARIDAAYMIEFGHLFMRFYTQHAQLQNPPGTPVEVATPWPSAALFNADKTCRLRLAQSGDVLYLAHPEYETQALVRLSALSFSLAPFRPNGGPFQDLNDTATTVYASAETGSVTLTASSAIFQAGHVGALFMLESKEVSAIAAWEVAKVIAAGNRRRSDAKTYQALNAATTGTIKPVHTVGAVLDGDTGVQWEYRDAGYGWARITAIGGGGTSATATVVQRLPAEVVGAPNATPRWAHGAWNGIDGWPTDVAFFRERLWFARRHTAWSSVASDFNDFRARNESGEVTADMAITLTLASGQINDIQWLLPDKQLLAGTATGEFAIGELSNGDPIGPGNVRAPLQSEYGSRALVPVKAGSTILFVQRSGRKVREISFDFGSEGYQSNDRTALAEHITRSGIIDMDFAQEPDCVVWCVRADGVLIGFTWNSEQNVWGWHRHNLGDGSVESVATIPSPDGSINELWLIVQRTINGVEKRYIEFMEKQHEQGDDQADSFYVDAGLTYDGAATLSVSGAQHLAGESVAILADGAPRPHVTVSAGGVITLDRAASKIQAGLPMRARIQTMRAEAGGAGGTAQGKTKRMHKVIARFHQTASGYIGPSFDTLEEITFRRGSDDPMDEPVPLRDVDELVPWPGGYETDAYICYENRDPLPSCLVALFPQIDTQDQR